MSSPQHTNTITHQQPYTLVLTLRHCGLLHILLQVLWRRGRQLARMRSG